MTEVNSISALPMEVVFPNPVQPRKDFDPVKLEGLAMSIRQYGVLEPIVVTPRGKRYMIIAGERRYRASRLAGILTIPSRVIEADDALVEELALLENVQRADLNIIEEAKAFQSLLDRGWSREELASKMGFKQAWRVDERTSLLRLTSEHQRLVAEGKVGNSQAFAMSRVSPANQRVVLKKILAGELLSYNKLRAFVDCLAALERQENIFELQYLSEEETKSVRDFEALLRSVERFIGRVDEEKRLKHLEKAAFGGVGVERVDFIIRGLQRLRKSVFKGEGAKEVLKAA